MHFSDINVFHKFVIIISSQCLWPDWPHLAFKDISRLKCDITAQTAEVLKTIGYLSDFVPQMKVAQIFCGSEKVDEKVGYESHMDIRSRLTAVWTQPNSHMTCCLSEQMDASWCPTTDIVRGLFFSSSIFMSPSETDTKRADPLSSDTSKNPTCHIPAERHWWPKISPVLYAVKPDWRGDPAETEALHHALSLAASASSSPALNKTTNGRFSPADWADF